MEAPTAIKFSHWTPGAAVLHHLSQQSDERIGFTNSRSDQQYGRTQAMLSCSTALRLFRSLFLARLARLLVALFDAL